MTPKVAYRDRGRYREQMGFGFHFFVDDQDQVVFLKKDGDNPGASCILSYYPTQDVTLVVLANQDCDVWQLSWEIHDQILALDADS